MRKAWVAIVLTALFAVASICEAGTATVSVSATVLSNHNCTFDTAGPLALAFGSLPNPPASVQRTASITFSCKGNKNVAVSYALSDDKGIWETGTQRRMRNGNLSLPDDSNAYIPYSLTLSPSSGTTPLKTAVTLDVIGQVGATYATAYVGTYSDTVVITLAP